MTPLLNRRRFLQALAASVVAAGSPLPVGLPRPTNPHPGMVFGIDYGGFGEVTVVLARHVNDLLVVEEVKRDTDYAVFGQLSQMQGFKFYEEG